jgi:ABC-type Fe3+-hydroxamate transport system substrate-binding protein
VITLTPLARRALQFAGLTILVVLGVLGAGLVSAHSASTPTQTTESLPLVGVETLPTNPTSIATSQEGVLDIMISIGMTPAYTNVRNELNSYAPYLLPYVKNIKSLGILGGSCSFNMEALAAAGPDLIIGSQFTNPPPCLSQWQAIAPVVLLHQVYPPLNAAGQAESIWKNWTMDVAEQLGHVKQADEVFERTDRRAAAIRGQVEGKTIAYMQMDTASTWNTANQYFNGMQPFVQDLGMKPFDPSIVDPSCTNDPTPVTFCLTASESNEDLSELSSADAIIVLASANGNAFTGSDIQNFISNPLWTTLPAVKDHHSTIGYDIGGGSPQAVANLYDAVESMFGIKEYFTTLSNSSAVNASLTLNPGTKKLCWAVDPVGRSRPNVPLTLTAGGKVGAPMVTLASAPTYTPSQLTYQTNGCTTLSSSFESEIVHSPSNIRLSLGSAHGNLKHGAPSTVVSS